MKPRSQDSILTKSRSANQHSELTDEALTESPQRRSPAVILFALASLIGLVAVIVGLKGQKTESEARPIDLANVEQRRKLELSVNRHIQMTNRKIEIEKERVRIESAFATPQVGQLVLGDGKEESRLDLRADRSEYNTVRDVDRRGEVSQPQFASAAVHDEMAEQQLQYHSEKAYREIYAKEYVENARRNGFEVKLDSEYRVISVRELPPSSMRQSAGEAYR